jgi:radical SAM superfamily enzyme YgiQ (UPF0313 family)
LDMARRYRAGTPRDIRSRETGAVIKDWGGRLPVALVYPNSYFLGMSNLGIHAIYKLLNDRDNVVCERFFHEPGNPPLSVESGRPLADFAVIAFSVSYEMDYFHIAPLLKAAGIPLYAADRDESHPLIIAGGPCVTANPMPVSSFFDCFGIGEAEAVLPAMLSAFAEGLPGRRDDLLKALAALPGVYVPALPPERPVVRQWAKDLEAFPVGSAVLTPDTELGDLFLIEVERGCRQGCRFCLVNCVFSPVRFRRLDGLLAQAREGLKYRKRIGLVGPAVADHPEITALLEGLLGIGAQLSISSLRISSLSGEIIGKLARGNARTITVAPEAGSERLRRSLNKDIPESAILDVADMAGRYKFRNLKLYFMIGLPTETDEDIEALIDLVIKMKARLDRHRGNTRLNVNISPFVPKAGTPWQRLPMATLETLNRRVTSLKKRLPTRGITLKSESAAWSRVQGILSRGNARLAPALAGMDRISLAAWRRSVEEYRLDTEYYIDLKWDTQQALPWSIIDSRIKLER